MTYGPCWRGPSRSFPCRRRAKTASRGSAVSLDVGNEGLILVASIGRAISSSRPCRRGDQGQGPSGRSAGRPGASPQAGRGRQQELETAGVDGLHPEHRASMQEGGPTHKSSHSRGFRVGQGRKQPCSGEGRRRVLGRGDKGRWASRTKRAKSPTRRGGQVEPKPGRSLRSDRSRRNRVGAGQARLAKGTNQSTARSCTRQTMYSTDVCSNGRRAGEVFRSMLAVLAATSTTSSRPPRRGWSSLTTAWPPGPGRGSAYERQAAGMLSPGKGADQ